MLLYHFTGVEYLDAIFAHGLSRGEVPLSPTDYQLNAVWLTTDRNPEGHGLIGARELTYKEKLTMGHDPSQKARFANKRAVRITVNLPSSDEKLVYWPSWGRKRCAPGWYETLAVTGGGKERTWYLYFGVIQTADFLAVERLPDGDTAADSTTVSPTPKEVASDTLAQIALAQMIVPLDVV